MGVTIIVMNALWGYSNQRMLEAAICVICLGMRMYERGYGMKIVGELYAKSLLGLDICVLNGDIHYARKDLVY